MNFVIPPALRFAVVRATGRDRDLDHYIIAIGRCRNYFFLYIGKSFFPGSELCLRIHFKRINRYSPRFVASLVSASAGLHDEFYATVDAPFVGDGFTRWVDGQYALDAPELGLSNWEGGRMLGRGGILSGDSVYTVRYRATVDDPDTHR